MKAERMKEILEKALTHEKSKGVVDYLRNQKDFMELEENNLDELLTLMNSTPKLEELSKEVAKKAHPQIMKEIWRARKKEVRRI